MLKKQPEKRISLKYPVILFRDDLIEIVNTIKTDLNPKEIKVSFGEYEASNIEDISENTKISNQISISSSLPYFSVNIESYGSGPHIWIGEYNNVNLGVAYKIKTILEQRSRLLIFWSRNILNNIVYILSIILGGMGFFIYDKFQNNKTVLIIFLSSFLVCWSIWSLLLFRKIKNKIYFCYKEKQKTFWERNKDSILVSVIVGVPSSIISLIIGYLIK